MAGWQQIRIPPPMTSEPQPTHSAPGYPVILDLAGRRCLVVGGGPVAARRALGLLAAGARVTVVAPQVAAAIDRMVTPTLPAATGPGAATAGGTLNVERRRYEAGEASRYDLVATATGVPEVDQVVVSDAVAAGVPVNSADRHSPGSVQLPAVHRDGPVVVAVSTGGASPALARWLRDRIAGSLPPSLAVVAELLEEARVAVKEAGRSTDSIDWEAAIAELVVPLVESGRVDEARSELLARCLAGGTATGNGTGASR
jgi:precorrin-2 dehydrogenase / sirohydrochlorin ferrochelatase